jgi:putative ABC transport system permease protein
VDFEGDEIGWLSINLIMQRWLQQFAYQIDISAVLFILAGFSLLAMALLTVRYYAVKTARANPVDILRRA